MQLLQCSTYRPSSTTFSILCELHLGQFSKKLAIRHLSSDGNGKRDTKQKIAVKTPTATRSSLVPYLNEYFAPSLNIRVNAISKTRTAAISTNRNMGKANNGLKAYAT